MKRTTWTVKANGRIGRRRNVKRSSLPIEEEGLRQEREPIRAGVEEVKRAKRMTKPI